MNIGVVGLGKVGLVLAQALRHVAGHDVIGYDLYPEEVQKRLAKPSEDIPEGDLKLASSINELVTCDVIFVVVQTPHPPEFDGTQPLTAAPVDFDYSFLIKAVKGISEAAVPGVAEPVVGIVSTVLPGTIRNQIIPFTKLPVVYCPVFISLGSVFQDLLNPPCVVIGTDDIEGAVIVDKALKSLREHGHRRPCHSFLPGIEEAELFKVAYNCYLSLQITFANVLGEICSKIDADVDRVTGMLGDVPHRGFSAGMGDGGACRPRDLVAMAWLADNLGVIGDPFTFMLQVREAQSMALAELVIDESARTGLEICILGVGYKAGIRLMDGSPSLLLYNQLEQAGHEPFLFDPIAWPRLWEVGFPLKRPRVFVVGTSHPEFRELTFPPDSVVIDPWGYLSQKDKGVQYITPGRPLHGSQDHSGNTVSPRPNP